MTRRPPGPVRVETGRPLPQLVSLAPKDPASPAREIAPLTANDIRRIQAEKALRDRHPVPLQASPPPLPTEAEREQSMARARGEMAARELPLWHTEERPKKKSILGGLWGWITGNKDDVEEVEPPASGGLVSSLLGSGGPLVEPDRRGRLERWRDETKEEYPDSSAWARALLVASKEHENEKWNRDAMIMERAMERYDIDRTWRLNNPKWMRIAKTAVLIGGVAFGSLALGAVVSAAGFGAGWVYGGRAAVAAISAARVGYKTHKGMRAMNYKKSTAMTTSIGTGLSAFLGIMIAGEYLQASTFKGTPLVDLVTGHQKMGPIAHAALEQFPDVTTNPARFAGLMPADAIPGSGAETVAKAAAIPEPQLKSGPTLVNESVVPGEVEQPVQKPRAPIAEPPKKFFGEYEDPSDFWRKQDQSRF